MKENGFTLVELMVVILVVGLLAAIGIPKMQVALHKAKASELPPMISQIAKAEHFYLEETDEYTGPLGSHAAIVDALGVQVSPSSFFLYTVLDPDGDKSKYQARATNQYKLGELNIGTSIQLDNTGNIQAISGSASAWKTYLRAWVGDDDLTN